MDDDEDPMIMFWESIAKIKNDYFQAGKAKGIMIGTNDTKFGIVRKMLEKKYPIEEIAELTGLSNDVIYLYSATVL